MSYLDILPDIPRYLTAIAEWSAVLIYSRLQMEHIDFSWWLKAGGLFLGQLLLQLIAGELSIVLWIPGMMINILWMLISLCVLAKTTNKKRLFLLVKSFLLSELLAATAWLLYCITIYNTSLDIGLIQGIFNIFVFLLLLLIVWLIETKSDLSFVYIEFSNKDILIGGLMGIITFTISNLGFLLSSTVYNLGNSLAIFSLRMFVNISGLSLLYIQQYLQIDHYRKQEINNMNRLFESQYQQYKMYAKSTEYINQKSHDLKHQINIIISEPDIVKREQYLSEIKDSINQLDVKVETGNAVLDTILTQKKQHCLENDINFTTMANGKLLEKLDVMDLSSLVGNALDNAIEYVEKLEDKNQRLITLKLTNKGQMVIFRVDNYFADQLESVDELPKTSKKNKENHGYGLKSIQHIAKKYNGNMSISVKDHWFSLNVILPIL